MAIKGRSMKWFCENIWHRLNSGKNFYIFLMLEMMVGSAILLICFNVFFTEKEQLAEYAKTNMSRKIAVTYTTENYLVNGQDNHTGVASELIMVTADDYENLKTKFEENLTFSLSNVFTIDMFLAEPGVPFTFQVYCMDDSFFTELFDERVEISTRNRTAYIGNDLYEFLRQAANENEEMLFSTGYRFWIENERLWIDGSDLFEIQKIEDINDKKITHIPETFGDGQFEMGKAIILPLSYSIHMEKMIQESEADFIANTQLKVGSIQGKADFSELNQLLLYLTKLNENKVTFRLSDQYLEIEKQYEDMESLLWYWCWIGGAFLVMVLCGSLGTLLLLQYRRRKSMIIQYFCGATRMQLYVEMLFEIMIVLLTGSGVGGVLVKQLLSLSGIGGIVIHWYWKSMFFVSVMTVLISCIAFLITYLTDKKIQYVYQIKEG